MNITIGGKNREVTDKQIKQIEKLLETELRTPDNIHLYVGERAYGLFFNNNKQVLNYHAYTGQWTVLAPEMSVPKNNRKLVLALREDLEPGDVVFRADIPDGYFDEIEGYGIVLNEKEMVYITNLGELHIDNSYYNCWWKVI